MLRLILEENITNLNDTEKEILEYVTHKQYNWFLLHHITDEEIKDVLYKNFAPFFGREADVEREHPFYNVMRKIVKNANVDPLIFQTDLYGPNYEELAKEVNKLWCGKYRQTILMILKAFAERDFDALVERFEFDITCEEIQKNIDHYADLVAENLVDSDLEAIINFCI